MEEIHDYFREKRRLKKVEILKAWIKFYKDYNNDWLASRVERQLKKIS